MRRAILPAVVGALLLGAAGCGDGPTVDTRDRAGTDRAPILSDAAADVVAQLGADESPQRIVYHPPLDLRRPAEAGTWPPTAEHWPDVRTAPDTSVTPR